MREQEIQNRIREALNPYGRFFRINVGQAWTGETVIQLQDGDVLIKNARPFSTGIPKGSSDLFGVTNSGQAVFIEVKTPTGRVRPEQEQFLSVMRSLGARAGIARSVEDAIKIVEG